MKLPSVQQVIQDTALTFKRFPFVLLVAATGTAAALLIVEREAWTDASFSFNILYAAVLGIPLLTGLALFCERRKWGFAPSFGVQAGAGLLLAVYAWTLPSNLAIAPEIHGIRLLMLAVGLHLFVAVAPFTSRGELNGFWHFNKTLFLRILTALLFTGVLFGGLAIALSAIENLFGVDIPGKRYEQLWILLNGMLTTWFFLAGVPSDLDALDALTEYPKGIKIFAQYVLLPLVFVYLLILAGYTGKIVIAWEWPFGWVSRLILGFSAAGMFALLLLHPIRKQDDNAWIDGMTRWFHVALAPLVVMYFLAVLRRISDYGITESRYVAIVTGVWLAAMVLYFLFSRNKSIKAIPATLCVISLLISVGPWGAFAISQSSQTARLERIFVKDSILVEGKVRKSPAPVSFDDSRQISSILVYLHEMHGYESIQPWFSENLRRDSLGMRSEFKDPSSVASLVGVEFVAVWLSHSDDNLSLDASRTDAMVVTGYDALLPVQYFDAESGTRTFESGSASYRLNKAMDTLVFVMKRDTQVVDTLEISLRPLMDSLIAKYAGASAGNIPLENMALAGSSDRLKVKVYLRTLRLRRDGEEMKPADCQIELLFSKFNEPPLNPIPGRGGM